MSIHIQVTQDAGTCHYRRHAGMWVMTDPAGWDHPVTVESTINMLNAVAAIGFGNPDQIAMFDDEMTP